MSANRICQALSQCVNALGRHDRSCPAAPNTEGQASNRQRAEELLRRLVPYEHVAVALDAAEARGRAEMAAKVEALVNRFVDGWPSEDRLIFRDRFRALVADAAPAGQDRPCLCGKPEADSIHHRPQTSDREHLYEPAPTEAEWYAAPAGQDGLREALIEATARYNTGAGGWLSTAQFADALLTGPIAAHVEAEKRAAVVKELEAAADRLAAWIDPWVDVAVLKDLRDRAAALRGTTTREEAGQ